MIMNELPKLISKNEKKIVYVIMDGLGGAPSPETGMTELETAITPFLDTLAQKGETGLLDPVYPGITPGSGPAHMALFGYNPIENNVGRGLLSALGIDFPLTPNDLAMRVNFVTLDNDGLILDRRAGRIPTETNQKLVKKIKDNLNVPNGFEFFMETESEHRAMIVLRAEGIDDKITETDPQKTGLPPIEPKGLNPESEKAAAALRDILGQIREILKDDHPANFIVCRGFAKYLNMPSMEKKFGLKAAAIAQYPMYRGLAKLVGMEVLPVPPTFDDMFMQLKENYSKYDFFYIHFKKTDSYGEDGNFDAKVKMIETVDQWVEKMVSELNPDVLVITGDHSTPATWKAHSFHPVPVLLTSEHAIADKAEAFNEKECSIGYIGRMEMEKIMVYALAHAQKLIKFGA
ncbi:MAG: 2,3-bisphosphoglycerate-independent phosphoglycerate mutase [Calditrichia bacterium]